MTINGLRYIERLLYLFPAFFTDLSLKRLFHKDITADQLNDDVMGSTLDTVAVFGPTELFNHIFSDCLQRDQFALNLVNTETTNFSIHGDYDSDSNTEKIEISYGHPKDGRWDLKRFVLGMVTNQYGIPLMVQTFSGNESDKKISFNACKRYKSNLKIEEKALHVADAAFYTEENLQTLGAHTFWICRVPMVISEADILRRTNEKFTGCIDECYSYYSSSSDYTESDKNGLSFTQVNNKRGKRSHLKRRLRRNRKNQENLKTPYFKAFRLRTGCKNCN